MSRRPYSDRSNMACGEPAGCPFLTARRWVRRTDWRRHRRRWVGQVAHRQSLRSTRTPTASPRSLIGVAIRSASFVEWGPLSGATTRWERSYRRSPRSSRDRPGSWTRTTSSRRAFSLHC